MQFLEAAYPKVLKAIFHFLFLFLNKCVMLRCRIRVKYFSKNYRFLLYALHNFVIANLLGLRIIVFWSILIVVLVLAGMELIFFTAAHTVVCFGFMTKTVLMTHLRFSHCWAVLTQPPGPFCFSHCPTSLGLHKNLGDDTTRTADPNRPKSYSTSHGVMFSNKTVEKKEEGGGIWSYDICLPI